MCLDSPIGRGDRLRPGLLGVRLPLQVPKSVRVTQSAEVEHLKCSSCEFESRSAHQIKMKGKYKNFWNRIKTIKYLALIYVEMEEKDYV